MSAYADSARQPPRTLLEREQKLLLKISGQHRNGFRDHVIFSLALGTGLREHEIVGLDVGDIYNNLGKARRRVQLRVFKKSNPDPTQQQIFLSSGLRAKLAKFYSWKIRKGESVAGDAPLFMSRNNNRLSKRQLRHLTGIWQKRAGFDQHYCFHKMRHSALSKIQRQYGDLRVTQRFGRHLSSRSTEIYTLPSDEEMLAAVESTEW